MAVELSSLSLTHIHVQKVRSESTQRLRSVLAAHVPKVLSIRLRHTKVSPIALPLDAT